MEMKFNEEVNVMVKLMDEEENDVLEITQIQASVSNKPKAKRTSKLGSYRLLTLNMNSLTVPKL